MTSRSQGGSHGQSEGGTESEENVLREEEGNGGDCGRAYGPVTLCFLGLVSISEGLLGNVGEEKASFTLLPSKGESGWIMRKEYRESRETSRKSRQ